MHCYDLCKVYIASVSVFFTIFVVIPNVLFVARKDKMNIGMYDGSQFSKPIVSHKRRI